MLNRLGATLSFLPYTYRCWVGKSQVKSTQAYSKASLDTGVNILQ
jgi:hypothetical protein